jgi:UDP-N-acetylmuramoylalanine--D-glutamate ligase
MAHLDAIFKGKKITQMGLGLLGRGVGDARFLAQNGAELVVTDIQDEKALQTSVEALQEFKNITFHLGGHTFEDFEDRDLILKGPSVPLDSPHIAHARKHNIPVDMSASLFARIAQIPIIGITGTRGKSTVTDIVHRILVADGRKTILGGNIKGVSNLSLLEEVEKNSIGIFELDSWQCQGFGEEISLHHPKVRQGYYSPDIAVFTTFYPDHLNYYKGDINTYLRDKVNIFLHQSPSDTLVLGKQAVSALGKYKKDIHAHVLVADEHRVPKDWKVPLVGVHNKYNIGIAVEVALTFGVKEKIMQKVVESLEPIPGRLEFIREVAGVRIFNDTNATTPDALAVALSALGSKEKKRIVLIAGGASKELDVSHVLPLIEKYTKKTIFLQGTGTDILLGDNAKKYEVVESLQSAVKKAFESASKGDVLLLSPGFASFGMFKNEYDRGEQFNNLVNALQ